MKEEIVKINEKLAGKDQAINALSHTLMEKGKEHEKMSEMVSMFKNKLMVENCFHVEYGAKRIFQGGLMNFKNNTEEVTIAFLRDRTFEEEFFLVIESKDFNPHTGCKDKKLIAVDDIDEIEHTDGL
jgi:uncharacterized coiled-coil protein SlyX